jgi:hypothetical protein
MHMAAAAGNPNKDDVKTNRCHYLSATYPPQKKYFRGPQRTITNIIIIITVINIIIIIVYAVYTLYGRFHVHDVHIRVYNTHTTRVSMCHTSAACERKYYTHTHTHGQ